jgi:hypothetical protein
MKQAARLSFGLLVWACCACADTGGEGTVARREFQQFQREAYPVLLRDCAFPACHGAPERFFRVWGPGRVRLPGKMTTPEAFDLPTGDELSTTYSLALSMIDQEHPKQSLLLRKPLAVSAGGAGHLGVDAYDRDVYRTAQDSGFLTLARWVHSEPPPAPAEP